MPDRRLRITQVMPMIDPDYGGPTEATLQLCEGLSSIGVDVCLVTTDRSFLSPEPHHLDPVPWPFEIEQHPVKWPTGWSRSPDLARALAARAMDADLIHTHTLYHHTTLAASRAAKRGSIPLVVEPHGSLNHYSRSHRRAKKAPYERLVDFPLIRRAAGVRCASSAECDDLTDLGLGTNAFVVPHGVLSTPGLPPTPDPERPIVLFLSRLAEKKRLDLTVEAFAVTLTEVPDARLRIVGSGDDETVAMTRDRITALGIGHAVELVGPRFGTERDAELAQASVFVLLSDDESFGMAPLEAICAGVPVVSTPEVASMRDLDGRAEVHLVGQDPVAAGQLITRVLRDHTHVERARAQALQLAHDHSWTQIAERMATEYERMVGGTRGGQASSR
jgi:glycosyltransferase involved in cell wall biosynthesis